MAPEALYAPWPVRARRPWGWGALGLVVASYLLSIAPMTVVVAIYMAVAAVGDPSAIEAGFADAPLSLLATMLLAQFLSWGALIGLWTGLVERRGPATLGLTARGFLPRYLIGLVLGVVLVSLIGLAAALLTGLSGAAPPAAPEMVDAARLLAPAMLGGFALIAVVFLVQGGMEEVVFRGWLMSALAARWGVRRAILASSLAFAVFHAHVFVSGLVFGIAALIGLGLTGLVFALFAVLQRSIVEIVAAHGAFNAAAVIGPTAVLLAADPELSLDAAVSQVFSSATGMAGADAVTIGPQLAAQTVACGLVAALIGLVLLARRTGARPLHGASEPAP